MYAIAEPPFTIAPLTGLEGAPVRVIADGELAAAVSDCTSSDVVASEDALWLHETVVEKLMAGVTLLPMRFGSVLADDNAVRALLADERDDLLAGLRRVHDAVEVAVRVTWEAEADRRDPTGTAYLVNRLERTRRAMDVAERMDATLSEMARASKRRVATSPALVLTCAYLVDRARLEEFRERVEDLGGELDRVSVMCTGPWPPYSFAAAEDE